MWYGHSQNLSGNRLDFASGSVTAHRSYPRPRVVRFLSPLHPLRLSPLSPPDLRSRIQSHHITSRSRPDRRTPTFDIVWYSLSGIAPTYAEAHSLYPSSPSLSPTVRSLPPTDRLSTLRCPAPPDIVRCAQDLLDIPARYLYRHGLLSFHSLLLLSPPVHIPISLVALRGIIPRIPS